MLRKGNENPTYFHCIIYDIAGDRRPLQGYVSPLGVLFIIVTMDCSLVVTKSLHYNMLKFIIMFKDIKCSFKVDIGKLAKDYDLLSMVMISYKYF